MPDHKITNQFYNDMEHILSPREYGVYSPEDRIKYVGMRAVGTGDVVELPYRHYWELKNFLRLIPQKRPLSILELGCGAGRYAVSLSPLATHITAVDMSKPQIDYAKQDLQRRGINNVTYCCENLLDYIPPEGESYDVIYFSGVLQYFSGEEIENVLSRILPSLKPDGVVVERDTITYNPEQYIPDWEGYTSIYRTSNQIMDMFAHHGLYGTAQGPAYPYLRFARLWRTTGIHRAVILAEKYFPTPTFHLMRAISSLWSVFYSIPDPKLMHTFFSFKKQL
ncbi:MAG: methyltransferase domain-containing protein [Planctomycetia bacterium]|nr:methyltransferase domain-containing protein [Planctomycetia bacterium]